MVSPYAMYHHQQPNAGAGGQYLPGSGTSSSSPAPPVLQRSQLDEASALEDSLVRTPWTTALAAGGELGELISRPSGAAHRCSPVLALGQTVALTTVQTETRQPLSTQT